MAELDTGGRNREGDVETVVHEQSDGLTVGQSDRELVMLATAQRTAARMKRQLRPTSFGKLAGNVQQVGAARDPFVRDRVQARERRSHVNLAPALSRAPRSQSPVGIRSFPAGCTSKISTLPPPRSFNGPVATTSEPSADRTSPGAPVPGKGGSMTFGVNSLISTPWSSEIGRASCRERV